MKHGNSRRRWLSAVLIFAGALAVVFLGLKIKQMNEAYPQVEIQDVERGMAEEVQLGVDMRIVDAKLFTMEEAQNRYGEEFIKEVGQGYSYKTVEVTILLKNETEEVVEIPLYDIYFEQEDYCNGLAPEVFFGIGNETEYVMLTENEAKEVTLGYLIFEKQFKAGEWERMRIEDFYLVRQRYPLKIRWRM